MARASCLSLLQRWSTFFYPERPDIWRQMNVLSAQLGGVLSEPELRPKYRWVQKAFGWRVGKAAQRLVPVLRWLAQGIWERLAAF